VVVAVVVVKTKELWRWNNGIVVVAAAVVEQ